MKNINKLRLLEFIICLISSLVFVMIFQGDNYRFADRGVFEEKYSNLAAHDDALGAMDLGETGLTSELLWEYMMRGLVVQLSVEPTMIFQVITFLFVFSVTTRLTKEFGIISLPLLINPVFVDFACSQLRMALAMTIFMAATRTKSRVLNLLQAAVTSLIHFATLLWWLVWLIYHYIERYKIDQAKLIRVIYLLSALILILSVGPLRSVLLGYIGDRRQDYAAEASSILYATFWFFLLILMVLQTNKYLARLDVAIGIVMLTVFIGSVALNFYGLRFLSASYPYVMTAMLALKRDFRYPALFLFFIYTITQWIYWIG